MEKIILISVFAILMVVLILIFYFFLLKPKMNERKDSIFLCLELDTKRWIIKKSNSLLNEVIYNEKFNSFFKNKLGNGWININKLFEIINPKDVIKWKKAIEYCIQNKSNSSINHEISFKALDDKMVTYFFNIKFIYINENHINIELRSKDKMEDKNLVNSIITKEELFKDKNKNKLFVSFNIEDNHLDTFVEFIRAFTQLIKIKNIRFFKSNSIIVIFLSDNSYRRLNRQKMKIQKKLTNSSKKSSIKSFYSGCSFVECANQIDENNLSKIMTRILFSLVKSKALNEIFHFNLKNILFNEFEEFKEKIMNMDELIKIYNFKHEEFKIESIKKNENSMKLYLPKINFDADYWDNYVIQMNEFDKKIRDKFIDFVLNNESLQKNKNILLNINDYQIEKMFSLMKKHKNITFIINQTAKYKKTIDFINLLKLIELSNINYALAIDKVNSKVISIIANVKPKLIILSEKINSNFNNDNINNKLRLIETIVITEKIGITLIFVNLTDEEKNEILLLSKKDKLTVNYPTNNFI